MTAKTDAERQKARRDRLAEADQKEVRGIIAHVADHEAVRLEARKVAAKLARKREKGKA